MDDALPMLIISVRHKLLLRSAALRYTLLPQNGGELYITPIGLFFYCIMCTGRLIKTLIFPTAHVIFIYIYIFLILVVNYTAWHLLRCSPPTYIHALHTSPDLFRRSKSSSHGSLSSFSRSVWIFGYFFVFKYIPTFSNIFYFEMRASAQKAPESHHDMFDDIGNAVLISPLNLYHCLHEESYAIRN